VNNRFAWVTRDAPIKIFSLFIALVLYFFVTDESAESVDVDFSIEYRMPDDIMLIGEVPSTINVTLSGPWASIRSYDRAKLRPVVVDLRNAGPGVTTHRISEDDIPAPGGMVVVQVRPSQIELNLDRQVERQVEVQADLGNEKPAFGYEVVDVDIEPSRVRVIGPTKAMQNLENVFTRPLDLAGRDQTFTDDIELRPLQAPLRLRDRSVSVTVEVREEFVTRAFTVKVVPAEVPAGVKVTPVPETVKVELRGPRRVLESFDKQGLVAYVDVAAEIGQGAREAEKPVTISGQPERASLTGAPPTVKVTIARTSKRKT
jgi:YbbR domain-containing protein